MSEEIVVKVKVEVDQSELDELKSVVKQHLEADAIRRKVIAKAAQEALDALDKIDYEVPVTRIKNLIRSRELTAEEADSIKAAVDARVRKPMQHNWFTRSRPLKVGYNFIHECEECGLRFETPYPAAILDISSPKGDCPGKPA